MTIADIESTAIHAFAPRGPLSATTLAILMHDDFAHRRDAMVRACREAVLESDDVTTDEDIQFTLFLLYASVYGSVEWIDAGWEWHPALVEARGILESAFEASLRRTVRVPDSPEPDAAAIAQALFDLTAPSPGPSLSRFLAKEASLEQAREFLIHRSIYTLREADPHSWAIPRLTGRAKAALVEIQSDEYGGGRPERVHAEIFARTMRGAGLDSSYGAYADAVPAVTLASQNAMSMFGLNRRLVGAIVGHLAAFEMTSSLPNRSYGDAFRRLGFDSEVTEYFDEHVEADAVHEQIAAHDLAGGLAEQRPELVPDIMYGAAACLALDDLSADHLRTAFEAGRSSLRAGDGFAS
jgi:hypothetical protein